jgi:hypothetical protein
MKRILLISVCFLFLMGVAYSAVLDVGVAETLEGNVSSLIYDSSSNLVKFSIEFYNTGSVPYKARVRTEIFNDSEMLFSGWSQEKEFMSGDKKVFDIYWYTAEKGNYLAKVKVYFGNDVKEYKKFGFSIDNIVESEDVFGIKNFRTYNDYIIFDLESSKDAENVTIIPDRYTLGWIFEQKVISKIPANTSKLVVLNYYPTVWQPSNITLDIVSDKGKYYTGETVEMSKKEGLTGLFYYVMDSLRMAFSK